MARLAFIVDDLGTGGSEIFLRDLVLGLRPRHDVQVVGLTAGGPVADELRAAGVPVRVLGLRRWSAPAAFLDLVSILGDGAVEVVHCERLLAGVLGVPAARLAGVGKIFVRRGSLPWWPGGMLRILDRLAMRRAHGVFVPTRAIRDGYAKEHGLPEDRFHVLPHGVKIPETAPAPPANGREALTIGCVANFNWRKDHATLLGAFAVVARELPGASLKLVGAGPDEEKVRAAAKAIGEGERVEFLGHRDDVPALLADFDCLVLPSKTEGFGRVLIEAMAAGVPVVATSVGGIPEVVADDRTGLLVPPGDAEALGGALLRVLREPEVRERLAAAAFDDLRERFDLDKVVAAYEEIALSPPGERRTSRIWALGDDDLEDVPCPLCGSDERAPVTRRPDGLHVVRCTDCHLYRVSPRPRKDALADLYSGEYFAGEGEFEWMRGYLEQGLAGLEDPKNYWSGLVDRLEAHSGGKGRMLDVGCSGGFFLEQARRQGWEPEGVEVSEAMVRFAREHFGIESIHHGHLDEAGLESDRFDAVLLHNLIEHVIDPVGTLREVHRVLRPGGVACLTTPNAKAVGLLEGAWGGFHGHFGHITFFTPETYRRLFREAGLEMVSLGFQNQHVSLGATRGLRAVMDGAGTRSMTRRLLGRARSAWRWSNRAAFRVTNALGYSTNLIAYVRKPGGRG